MFALWWLAALRGLRCGELCGLHWAAVDLDRGLLIVERQRTTAGYQVVEGEPKTAAGRRAVALDKHTIAVLRAHRHRQLTQRDRRHAVGKPWVDSGHVFTRKDGEPINPSYATTRSGSSPTAPVYPRSNCTICATAPLPSPTKPARI